MRNAPIIGIEIKYDRTINSQNNIKFLRININDTLHSNTHLYHPINKLSVACYAIRVFKHLMPLKPLVIIYYAYFHTLMNYRILLWGKSPYSIHIYRLKKLKKK